MKSRYKMVCMAVGFVFFTQTAVCVSTKKTDKKNSQETVPTANMIFAEQLTHHISKKNWHEALALFDALDDSMKESVSIQNLKVAVLLSKGDIAAAEKLAKQIERKNVSNTDILYTLAMLAQAKNDMPMRTRYLNKIIRLEPKNTQALFEQGLDLYNTGRYRDAGKNFSIILTIDPLNRKALVWLGKMHYMMRELEEAEKCYTRALQIEHNDSFALAEFARIKAETKRMAEAVKDIKQAIRLDPEESHHWIDLGSYCMQSGKKDEAIDAFTRAISLVPDSHLVHIYLAGLYDDAGNKDKSIKHYTQVTKLYPQYYFAYESLGILLFEKQDWAGAESAFISALKYAPANFSYALMVGVCRCKAGKKDAAKHFMNEYLKTIDRKKAETDYFLCRLFVDFAGDIDVSTRIGKEKSASDRLRKSFYLGAFYQLTGKWTLAEKYYLDIKTTALPSFFEYRLAVSELENH